MDKIKIAIFCQEGNCTGSKIPKGCPIEYGNRDKRHLLAQWLEKNADNNGPYIVTKWESGATTYEYLSENDLAGKRPGEPEELLTRVAVVEVDVSRPWMIFSPRGAQENYWERIYYLDKVDGQNRVMPDYLREEIGHFRYGEEEERENIILDKRDGGNPVSISLVSWGDSRKRFRSAKTVEEAIELFREFADFGIDVDTFFFVQECDRYGNIPNDKPNCLKVLVWLEERFSIDPDFRLPRKIEAQAGECNFTVHNRLSQMYGWENVERERVKDMVCARRKGSGPLPSDRSIRIKTNFKNVAGDTLKIINSGKYEVNGREIRLPREECYSRVLVYPLESARSLLSADGIEYFKQEEMCRISVVNEDSLRAAGRFANPMVLNFANAGCPGGGFQGGAATQEETLCRCSTLLASLASARAAEMYDYNGENPIANHSDYMLFSPYVVVFRDMDKGLLEKPFVVAVASVPAPDAFFKSDYILGKVMRDRIRRMLIWAMEHRHKNVILGAWGCGGCHNSPRHVASCFKKVLVEDGFGLCFDEVCFAINGKPGNRNLEAFEEVLAGVKAHDCLGEVYE